LRCARHGQVARPTHRFSSTQYMQARRQMQPVDSESGARHLVAVYSLALLIRTRERMRAPPGQGGKRRAGAALHGLTHVVGRLARVSGVGGPRAELGWGQVLSCKLRSSWVHGTTVQEGAMTRSVPECVPTRSVGTRQKRRRAAAVQRLTPFPPRPRRAPARAFRSAGLQPRFSRAPGQEKAAMNRRTPKADACRRAPAGPRARREVAWTGLGESGGGGECGL
jgi:hypothetical protein